MTVDELVALGRVLVEKRQAADAAENAFHERDDAEVAYQEACQAFLASLPDPTQVPIVEPAPVVEPVPAPEPVVMPPVIIPAPVVAQSTDLAHPAPEVGP